MTTTRRTRTRTESGQFQGDDPSTGEVNEAWKTAVAAEDLVAYINWPGDEAKLSSAIRIASEAIRALLGGDLPERLPHELAQALRLTATKLLLTDKLDGPMAPEDVPAVARYFVQVASAQS